MSINPLRRSLDPDKDHNGPRTAAPEPYQLNSVTFSAVVRGTEHQVCRLRAARFLPVPPSLSILNSSSLWPVSRASTSHRGRLPLPDHVSDGASGLQYLGRTFGYLRRGARSVMDSGRALPGPLMISTRFNFAKRSSNSRFSTTIFSESTLVSSSWSNQSSSNSIATRSGLLIAFS